MTTRASCNISNEYFFNRPTFLPVLSAAGGNPAVAPNCGWKLLVGAAVAELEEAALSTEAKGFPDNCKRSSEALSAAELLVVVTDEVITVVDEDESAAGAPPLMPNRSRMFGVPSPPPPAGAAGSGAAAAAKGLVARCCS